MPTGEAFQHILLRLKTALLCVSAVLLVCLSAWGAGISIPTGSTLDVGNGQLLCEEDTPCTIAIDGTLRATTGSIRLNGDWTVGGTGYFDSGTSTVFFSATSGIQTITPGTNASDSFYHLNHVGVGTVAVSTNPLIINGTFSNLSGTFNAGGMTMNLYGSWVNSSAASPSFVHNNNTVNLVGLDQGIYGDTTFYNLDKHLLAAPGRMLIMEANKQQVVNHQLTLQGVDSGNRLTIVSSNPGAGPVPNVLNSARLQLSLGASQSITNVAVSDNDARGGVLLVARGASQDDGRNQNWSFGSVTVKWDGSEDSDWNNPFNWNIGLVPGAGDTAIIRAIDEDNGNAAIANQPVLNVNGVSLGALEIRVNSTLTLNQHNITVTGLTTNAGTIALAGTETFTTGSLTQAATSVFKYVGISGGVFNADIATNFVVGGSTITTYQNLVVEGVNAVAGNDNFSIGSNLVVTANATFTRGDVVLSSGRTLTVGAAATINGADVNAQQGSVVLDDYVLSGGSFSAPAAGNTFSLTGDFTHSGGTFSPNDGTVSFIGTDAGAPSNQTVRGSTGFYALSKAVPGAATQTHSLTFWSGDTFLVSNTLILTGLDATHRLYLVSSTSGSAANLRLLTGGVQDIRNVSVQDNNASGGLLLVGRGSSVGVSNYTNWAFGAVTMRWSGTTSTAWATPSNWDIGLVPIAEDTAVIRALDEDNSNAAIVRQPLLATDVTVGNMNIRDAAASLTLAGHNLTVASTITPPGSFTNSGSLILNGNENISIPLPYIPAAGTFVYRGDGAGTAFNITGAGMPNGRPSRFFNLTIQDPPAGSASTFTVDTNLYVDGSLVVSGASTLNAAANSVDIAQNFTMTGGFFTAPGSTKSFTIAGNFTHTAGTFTANGGTVVLDGTSNVGMSEQVVTGATTFYNLSKTIPPGAVQIHRLTMDNVLVQTATHNLALHGIAGNLLQLRSISADPDAAVRDAPIALVAGGLQQIDYVDVYDSNASGGITLVARTSDDHSNVSYNNTNWIFGVPTLTWTGTTSTNWADPTNWNLGIVPLAGDDVVIAATANQPHLTAASGAVNLRNLTLQNGTTLSLDGYGLTVTGAFTNNGNVSLIGTESVAITNPDTLEGTFTYTGNNTGTPIPLNLFDAGHTPLTYYNLVINAAALDVFRPATNLVVNGNLTINGGVLDLSTVARSLTVAGTTTVTSGTLNATSGSLALGSFVLNGGTLLAPQTGNTFTVTGNWTNTSGTFTHNNGDVTFNGTTSSTIAGNNTFYDLSAVVPSGSKTIYFTAGSNQTVANTLEMTGSEANDILLRSTVNGTPWTITMVVPQAPMVTDVDVRDSIAIVPGASPYITALNSVDQKNGSVSTNSGWVFFDLDFIAPVDLRTVTPTPTIIGHGLPGQPVTIKDGAGAVVATALVDVNGNYRVVVGEDGASLGTVTKTALDVSVVANDRLLTPYYSIYAGNPSTLTVAASTTPDQTPVIDSPADNTTLYGLLPVITGRALAGQTVQIILSNSVGNVLITVPPVAYAGTGTSNGTGDFSFAMTTPLARGYNKVSVLVNGVSSEVFTFIVFDVRGVVFDSETNLPIKGASVTLLKSDGSAPVAGVDIDVLVTNPMTTDTDGIFSFLTKVGAFKLLVSAPGYDFPTTLTDAQLPAGRAITTGSRGEVFTPTGAVESRDLPVDPNPDVFKIEKKANKTEAKIGEVVTYTVTIESLLESNSTNNSRMSDLIPPGFKFMSGRALLDGVPLVSPEGGRPLVFLTGDFTPRQKKTLRYQLVIGSGVAPGSYENTAMMKSTHGARMSNLSHASVKVVLDPLFDAGTVFGKVFWDLNENGRQDDPDYIAEDRQEIVEGGVPNVKLVMEDGTQITADKNGQFSIPALLPGRHLLRLDERSLPQGAYLTTDKVQVVDVSAGSIIKMNFGINMDNVQVTGQDAQFFQKEFLIDQSPSKPVPRLNINIFNEFIPFHNDAVIDQIEFRMFLNYAPFINSWQMDVLDSDTKKVVRSFKGTRANIFDPILWDGRDSSGRYLRSDRKYSYVLKVKDDDNKWDETKELSLAVKVLSAEEMTERQRKRSDQEKKEESSTRASKYRAFLTALVSGDALKIQNIWVKGDTLVFKSAAADVRQIRVIRNGELYTEVPVLERQGLTARELLNAGNQDSFVPMELILPDGDYELEVASAQGGAVSPALPVKAQEPALEGPAVALNVTEPVSVSTQRYKKSIKVGEDYFMFVAMGDGKVGYNLNKGSVEPISNTDKFLPGFYKEGKMAYYLKGKIKGKYVVTSSFDTERQTKEALRTFKDDQYYPIYGDSSTVNYDATNTEGPLYLCVDWDKSQAIWGNYAVAFNNTEFANYTRTLYGGKLDYKTVASTAYGEPKTNVVVFSAATRQRTAHNEFLATGGSLYYLKNLDVVKGTDKLTVQVRDSVTGLVKSTVSLQENVDYDLDYTNGRILFWRPISMAVDSNKIISNGLLDGDPVYVVVDYEYYIQDQLAESKKGTRVTQALGKNVVAGMTYVSETQAAGKYELKGEDVTVHLGPDATLQAEYAQTLSKAQNSYISTDGGITFSELGSSSDISGRAYGIKQDARLFDRVGLKSYYKWIDAGFSTGGTSSQQGKELMGLSMTFDVTPVTRLTMSRDIQRLIDQGNLQTSMQVGAKETTTTLVQLVHDARRLRLTYEFQGNQVKDKKTGYVSTTNTQAAAAAFQAEYALNEKTDLVFKHQQKILGGVGQSTTLGVKRQLTAKLSASLEETVGTDGVATKAGVSANVTPKLAVSTDYTLAKARTGETLHTMTVAGKGNINDKTSLQTSVSMTQTPHGIAQEETAAVGFATKLGDDADVKAAIEKTLASTGMKDHQALALEGSRHGKEGRETTTGVKVVDDASGGKTTLITAGEKGMINPTTQFATERSFGIGTTAPETMDTYKISKVRDGRTMETSYTRKQSTSTEGYSDSNIFGLTGDINDRVAVQGSLERGKVQNVDGSITDRTAITGGVGYVKKGLEPGASSVFESSTKAEVRFDKGATDKQQYVFYQSMEGKINEQTSLSGKFSYSTTRNMDTKKAEAGYKEIVLGAAYRPIAMDRLNVFGKYSYKENKASTGQSSASDVEATKMHVVTAGAAFEINEKWELVERLAMRIMEEKVSGFEFARTHTWLLINRANYSVNKDWKIGAEYRILTVKEARDRKSGFLLEAVHGVNDNMELGIGWNFTNFVDDLTNLDYTVQGPFIRMTGKLYDQSPEERARAKAKWLDHRVDLYAKKMIRNELTRKDGALVAELNKMYQEAQEANTLGKYDEARNKYKDIILVTQMMYEEAAQFVRNHIAWEERVYNAFLRAREYFDKGEFWQARKLWEKIVEEASKAVLE